MKIRGLIAILLTALVLAIPSGRASASTSVPTLLPFPTAVAGDYVVEAVTCTPTGGTGSTCAEIIDEDFSGKNTSTPMLAAFGCYHAVNGQPAQAEFVVFGNGFGSTTANSTGSGIAGVTSETGGPGQASWQASAENFLFGSSTVNPFNGGMHGGTTSGVSLGTIKVDNATRRVTSGSIFISVSGTIWTSTGNSTRGSMSCTISPAAPTQVVAFATNQNFA